MDLKNIFVVGMDDFNRRKLASVSEKKPYKFHTLFEFNEVAFCSEFDIPSLVKEAERRLDQSSAPVDGIMGFWDFPTMSLVSLLCQRNNLPGPSLKSVLKCEHKYWSRYEQAQVIPEAVPQFRDVNPFDQDAVEKLDLEYPFWLKPVKSYSSYLGLKIHNKEELREHLKLVREKIGRFARPFNYFLDQVDRPEEIAPIDGFHCVAEELIGGRQCTVEGYVYEGQVVSHGIIDSLRHEGLSSFASYRYPSNLPTRVKERLFDLTEKVMTRFGYNNAAFNIEYFWDEETDKVWLLEVNSRISQSHADIFEKVDGTPNQEIVADLCVGQAPNWAYQEGEFSYAGKFFYREFEDAEVVRVPSEEELQEIEQLIPGAKVVPQVEEGMWLSELPDQDSYSFEVAQIYVGGKDETELLRKYDACLKNLPFRFRTLDADVPRKPESGSEEAHRHWNQ